MTRCRLGGGVLLGNVKVGLSPNLPLAVGISAAGTGAAPTFAAGTAGPRLGAALQLAEPLAAAGPDAADDPETVADEPGAPEVAGVPVVDGVDDDVVPHAASARSGRAAMTARMRMKKSFGSTVEFLDGAVRPDAGQPTRVRPI